MSTNAELDWTDGLAPQLDLPDTSGEYPELHEAIWTWGYDPVSRVGYRLYLISEHDDHDIRIGRVSLHLPDGRILGGEAPGKGSGGATARGGGASLECVEPFRTWRVSFQGQLAERPWYDSSVAAYSEQVKGIEAAPGSVDVDLSFTMEAAAPAWNVEGTWGEKPPNLRFQHLYRMRDGALRVGGQSWPLAGSLFRGHSRRYRDHSAYTGHVLATALFEGGRAFGTYCFRSGPAEPVHDPAIMRRPYGYVILDGQRHHAELQSFPIMGDPQRSGESLRLELVGDFGSVGIDATTVSMNWSRTVMGGTEMLAREGYVRYEWDGETSYGVLQHWHPAELSSMAKAGN